MKLKHLALIILAAVTILACALVILIPFISYNASVANTLLLFR